MTLEQIEKRKQELLNKISEAKSMEEVEEIRKEIEALKKEVPEKKEITREEERRLIADTEDLEKRNIDARNLRRIGGNQDMEEERKFTTADKEYRTAWAKIMMGKELEEIDKRALGDAIGTTAEAFVAATADTQGINNLGLLVPETVRTELLELAEKESPIFRDIRKLQVNGNIDLPYLFQADDAEWVSELTETKNEGQEYKNLKITGHDLAKDVVITWKAENMSTEGFISFIIEELYEKMYKAKVNAVIYGDGQDKPTGITKGLTPKKVKTGDTVIDLIANVLAGMTDDARIGAKVYVSSKIHDSIVFYKDANGNYPYLIAGLGGTKIANIEKDPFLKNMDIVAGNMRNYIFNENEPIKIDKETTIKGRKVTYGAYQLADGMPRPDFFAYGKYEVEEGEKTV